jgi:hypothetical protein
VAKEYLEISPKTKGSQTHIILTNGDIVYKGGEQTIYEGQWFFYNKSTDYTCRLLVKTYKEALEAYQLETGNVIL